MNLSSDRLSGSSPAALGTLIFLQSLVLNSNQLSGPVPAAFGNFTSLQSLNLSSNQLSGSIPSAFGNRTSSQYLYLSSNRLSGLIPAALGSLTSLRSLDLSSINCQDLFLLRLEYEYIVTDQVQASFAAMVSGAAARKAGSVASRPVLKALWTTPLDTAAGQQSLYGSNYGYNTFCLGSAIMMQIQGTLRCGVGLMLYCVRSVPRDPVLM